MQEQFANFQKFDFKLTDEFHISVLFKYNKYA